MNTTYLKQETSGERISPVAAHTDLLLEARMRERKRIAQELHDTLLQGFAGIGLKLGALASSLPSSLAPLKSQVRQFLEESEQYLAEARRAIWELRSPLLQKSGDFASALAKVSQRALDSTGVRLSFSVEGTESPVEPFVEANLLRICEEAVANAAKHAHPKQVQVFLAFGPKSVQLQVRDDGCGFEPTCAGASDNGHFGLLGIEERVAALFGILSVKSAPGRGTMVQVSIPIDGTAHGKAQENSQHGRPANRVPPTSTISVC
jgi:signal transduction histidine kinase